MLAARCAFQQETVHKLAGEPDPDAAAPRSGGVEPLWDQIVEWPVEVRKRDVDRDPGNGQLGGGHPASGHAGNGIKSLRRGSPGS